MNDKRRIHAGILMANLLMASPFWPTVSWAGEAANSPAALTPAEYADEQALVDALWESAPDVLDARAAAGVAASEVERAHQLPNPQSDFTWGTIPIGASNPAGLHNRLDHVPNYTTGISELIELAKRGPRQAATAAELEQARALATATLADRFFELLQSIGSIAQAELRVSVTDELVDSSTQLLELDRVRTSHGDLAAIDLDRAEVEHLHLTATRDAAVSDLEHARAQCAALAARPCEVFATPADARAFILAAIETRLPESWSTDIEQRRPDLSALSAALKAAEERKVLATRKVLPDVTARVGYVYDSFEISGNQQQSLSLGVQVPLPVFDRGQADVLAAEAALIRAKRSRESLVNSGQQTIAASGRRRQALSARLRSIEAALDKARGVRDAMVAAQQRGGMSMIDVLLARRDYAELLLDGVTLLGDAFDATVESRKAAALFPRPQAMAEEVGHE